MNDMAHALGDDRAAGPKGVEVTTKSLPGSLRDRYTNNADDQEHDDNRQRRRQQKQYDDSKQ